MAVQKHKRKSNIVSIIPRCYNSSLVNGIPFEDMTDKEILYKIDEMYKVGSRLCNYVMLRNIVTGQTYLVEEDSVKELINRGYVVNAMVDSCGYIKDHPAHREKYGLTSFPGITLFNQDDFLDYEKSLLDKHTHVIIVDNLPNNRILHRLEVSDLIFDLSCNIAAMRVKNEFEDYIISLYKAIEMGKQYYNQGNVFPNTPVHNATRLLPYYRIDEDYYEHCLSVFGDVVKNSFTRNSSQHEKGELTPKGKMYKVCYKCNIDALPLTVARYIFGKEHVYFAIPNPDKFEDKIMFESSIKHADYLEDTRYTNDRYTLVKCINFDRESAIELLMQNFEELHTGEYLKDYANILAWLLDKKKGIDNNILNNLRNFVYSSINDGKSEDEILNKVNKRYNIKISDSLNIVNIDQIEEGLTYMKNASHEKIMNSQNFRNPTFEELMDMIEVSDEYTEDEDADNNSEDSRIDKILDTLAISVVDSVEDKKPSVEDKKPSVEDKKPSVEDKKPSVDDKKQCLNTMYINDSCSIIIKLVREGRDVYIELTDEVQNETIEVANSRVVYSDYINNGINNKMLEKSLYRIVSIAKSKVKVDDIIKELIL